MALDRTNTDVSFAAVRVLVSLYLEYTHNTCSSSARTSVIHREKFNALLRADEHNELFNFMKTLKAFTG